MNTTERKYKTGEYEVGYTMDRHLIAWNVYFKSVDPISVGPKRTENSLAQVEVDHNITVETYDIAIYTVFARISKVDEELNKAINDCFRNKVWESDEALTLKQLKARFEQHYTELTKGLDKKVASTIERNNNVVQDKDEYSEPKWYQFWK